MNNSKKTFTTFLIVFSTMLLSFWVGDAILSMLGHFIVLDRISVFFVITIAFVLALVKACSGMKVSEVMLTLLMVVLLADGVGIIGFSILSANYLTALFLIPLIIVSFALIFTALHRRKPGKAGKNGRRIAILVFSLVMLALVGFAIVYFHAERIVTLKQIQGMQAVEKFDFKSLFSAFEVGFSLNRTILVIALAVSALVALVSSVRHRGKGYGTLAFLLGLFFFDGIGICYFAFATGDYLTGAFLIPLMLVAFSLVIGFVVHRVSGWKPDTELLGKAVLAFALVFFLVFLVAIGFYYVKSNTMPDEVLLSRDLPSSGFVEFGASESLGRGSLVVPTVIILVTALFLFAATKLSEAPYRKARGESGEIPWQILLSIEGFILSAAFIFSGFYFYGILGPVILGIAVGFLIAVVRRKSGRHSSRAFISFYVIFLLAYVGGLVYFRNAVNISFTLPLLLASLACGIFCAVLLGWALRFMSYREGSRESIKVVAILVAIISLLILCFFGYQLRMNPPQEIEEEVVIEVVPEPEPVIEKDKSDEPSKETEAKPPVVDVDVIEPEPECEVVVIPEMPVFELPPKAELVELPAAVPSSPALSVRSSTLVDLEPRIPTAPEGLIAWGYTYEDGWDDDWSEDDWVDDTSDDDFWADFFIAGEDELSLEDGLYYMTLFINGNNYGEIEVDIVDEDPGIPVDFLTYYLEGELTDEAWEKMFSEGGSYVYLSHMDEIGVQTSFDRDKFQIFIDFDTSFMPVKTLSLLSGSSFFKPRPIEGAMKIEPATFVLNTRYNLSLALASIVKIDPASMFNANLSLSNSMRIKDWYSNFGLYFNYVGGKFDFSIGAWSGYKDFNKPQLRLSFGNISGFGSLGVKLEHNQTYGSRSRNKSQLSELVIVEKESEITVINEGREIYRRRVVPGNYRLEDFILYTGANSIEIHIKPIDGSPEQVIDKGVIYSTGLLAPGEFDWGLSLNFGKSKVLKEEGFKLAPGTIGLPWFGNNEIVYDFRNINLNASFRTGFTSALSFSAAINLANTPVEVSPFNMNSSLTIEMTHVNRLGTTRYNFNAKDKYGVYRKEGTIPGFYGRIGHQVNFDNPYFSNLSIGVSYSSPEYMDIENRHSISINLGFGGRLGILGWNMTGFTDLITDQIEKSRYNFGISASIYTGSKLSISAGMNVSGNYGECPGISGRISGSYSFKNVNTSISSDFKGINASVSGSKGKHSASVSAGASDMLNVDDYDMDVSYSYAGNMFGLGLNFDVHRGFDDLAVQLDLSTSSVLADGLMTFGASVPSNFLMISQKGAIKGNEVSVASIGSSSSVPLPTLFGVSLYTGVSNYSNNGLSIYSTSDESFGSSASYDVSLVPREGMQGYVLKLVEAPSFSISGIAVTPAGDIWANGSSPLYEVSVDDEGLVIPSITEDYMFTDETGRFIINELKPGLYGFDMDYDGEWIFVIWDVEDVEITSGEILILKPEENPRSFKIEEPYADAVFYVEDSHMGGEAFWNMLFPDM